MKWYAACLICLLWMVISLNANSQNSFAQEAVYRSADIRTAKLYRSGDQTSFPAIPLGSIDGLELHFDDFSSSIKNYYYSYQLCNWDWTPSVLQTFEYTKGFQQVRITNYRASSIASTRYIHYQASVPDRNAFPTKSGNYLLKVFVNGDTSKTVLTQRFVVVDSKAAIAAQLQQPFNGQIFRTHQKLAIGITTDNRIQTFSPQDLKVVVLQNNNWQSAYGIDRPTITRGNYYEYSDESFTAMPAGKEWRWLDLRSLRLRSDRMQDINTKGDTTHVYVKRDVSRDGQLYVYYRDMNGRFTIETLETVNPFWQSEYGLVHFTYVPPGGRAFRNDDVFLFGEFTNYATDNSGLLTFNEQKGVYETTLYLKQGFYNYNYVTKPSNGKGIDFSATEGNYWGTENVYTVLVYYRAFGARADELVGSATVHSNFQR